jgi:glucose/arabinose dehydrogenase
MTKSTTVVLTFAAFAGGALAWQGAFKLPPPFHTPSATNRPQVIARPDGAQLRVPQGFQVEEFATGFQRPRIMIYTPNSDAILLTETVPNGTVTVLFDKNKDFKADQERRKLIEGLDRPYGMAFWKDYLYVAETTSVKRYKFDAKALSVGKGERVVDMSEFGKGHSTRTGCATWKWRLGSPAALPIVLESAVKVRAAECEDGVCTIDRPEHAGLFEAMADDGLATGFDHP